MKKLILIAALFASAAHAACITGPIISNDKALHLVGEAIVANGLTYVTHDPWIGVGATIVAGAAREWYKIHRVPGGNCEYSSIAYDFAGMALGTWTGYKFWIEPRPEGGITLKYMVSF